MYMYLYKCMYVYIHTYRRSRNDSQGSEVDHSMANRSAHTLHHYFESCRRSLSVSQVSCSLHSLARSLARFLDLFYSLALSFAHARSPHFT